MRAAAPENQKNIQDYLSAYCFGDFYTRKFLPIHERELLTFSILASQGGCEGQVKAHVGGNATVGNGRRSCSRRSRCACRISASRARSTRFPASTRSFRKRNSEKFQ
ncbi:MAG: carboxymuconolactone decarboxylase family protein [Oscillibacter sp.]